LHRGTHRGRPPGGRRQRGSRPGHRRCYRRASDHPQGRAHRFHSDGQEGDGPRGRAAEEDHARAGRQRSLHRAGRRGPRGRGARDLDRTFLQLRAGVPRREAPLCPGRRIRRPAREARRRASKLKPGNGLDKDSRMGPMHTETQRAEVEAQLKDAVDRGAKVVYGGGRPSGGDYDKGWFIEPTIVENVPDGARMWTEEVFGPALPVRRIKDLDEGLQLANDTQFGLGSSIWTANMAAAHRAVQELEAGYTWVNSIVIAHDELP